MNWPDDFINKVICSECLEAMKLMPDNSVDAVVTDPPAEAGGFLAKKAVKKVKKETKI